MPSPKDRLLGQRCLPFAFVGGCLGLVFLTACGGGGGSASSPPPPPPPPPSDVTTIALLAKHLVYDSTRQLLYASVAGADPAHPNTVVVIDPSTSSIAGTIPVGSNPNQLALSRDAQFLYVGTDGDSSVQRIDLKTRQVVLTIPLGANLTAGSMSVMPGRPSTVAIDLGIPFSSPPFGGVKIFDDAVKRPNSLDEFTGRVDQIAFSDSGNTIYGAQISESGWALYRFNVDANGVTVRDNFPQIFSGYDDGIVYDTGRIYTYHGLVFDPTNMDPLGSFPVTRGQPPMIDPSGGYAYYPATGSGPPVLNQFSLTTYVKTGSLTVQTSGIVYYRDLVKIGNNGFGFVGGPGDPNLSSIILTKQSLTPVPSSVPILSNVLVNHLVYDPARQRIYASLPSAAGTMGNSVAIINPTTSTIEKFIPVGSEPSVMAVSSDGSYLYVGLDGAASVARVNLSTQSVDQTFQVGQDPGLGFAIAISIAAMPGSPQTVAVATREVASLTAVFGNIVFDNGVPRSNLNPPTCASDIVTFGGSPGTLYGFDGGTLEQFRVDAGGITCLSANSGLIFDQATQIQVDTGQVYVSDGAVIDPLKPARAGIFTIGANRGLVVDDAAGETYFLADDRGPNQGFSAIFAFDKKTFVYRGKMQLPAHWGQGFDLTKCGSSCFAYATSPGVSIVASNFTTATPPPAANLPVYHLLYDPGRKKIYASVSGGIPGIGNSIVTIDPASHAIERSVYVGSEPDPLAISDDGSALYVGLDAPGSVVKIDLPGQTPGTPVWLGNDSSGGALVAQYISVMPGNPDVIAASRTNSGVAILDHGVQLPDITDSPFIRVNSITFGDASDLYGFNNTTTGFDFYRMKVNGSGVTISDDQPRLIYGFGANIQSDLGLIYSTNGTVVDPIQDTIGATFAGAAGGQSVALDDAAGRVYFVTYDVLSRSSTILAYDKNTSALLGSQKISLLQNYGFGASTQSFDLIRHDSGFTYATADGQVVFANVSFPPPVDLPLNQLPANHLIYDAVRQRLYASIPGRGGLRANTITVINPATGTIDTSIPIGSEPGVMALSGDANYLYVAMQGATLVKRINLSTQQVDLQFGLGADSFAGPKFAQDISVMPGNSDVVAVAKMFTTIIPPAAGVGIFNHGVELPNGLTDRQQSNSLAFSSVPGILYGFENDQTSFNFNRMQVDANGVTLTDATCGLIVGVATIRFDGGLVYSTSGTVVNPATRAIANSFPGVGLADAVIVDDILGRAYFLKYDQITKSVNILAFDKSTYQLISSATVAGATAEGTDLVRWGADGFAVSTPNEVILIAHSPLAQTH